DDPRQPDEADVEHGLRHRHLPAGCPHQDHADQLVADQPAAVRKIRRRDLEAVRADHRRRRRAELTHRLVALTPEMVSGASQWMRPIVLARLGKPSDGRARSGAFNTIVATCAVAKTRPGCDCLDWSIALWL